MKYCAHADIGCMHPIKIPTPKIQTSCKLFYFILNMKLSITSLNIAKK